MKKQSRSLWVRTLFVLSVGAMASSCSTSSTTDTSSMYKMRQTLNAMRSDVEDLKYRMHNYEVDMRIVEEKIGNQDVAASTLQEKLAEDNQVQVQSVKSKVAELDRKTLELDRAREAMLVDLQKLQEYSASSHTAMSQFRTHMDELKNTTEVSHKQSDAQIANLKEALESLLRLVQPEMSRKDVAMSMEEGENGTYRVRKGDTLGHIARKRKTTVETIKALNELPDDRIYVDQVLKLP